LDVNSTPDSPTISIARDVRGFRNTSRADHLPEGRGVEADAPS
jgi:hypothetical protein